MPSTARFPSTLTAVATTNAHLGDATSWPEGRPGARASGDPGVREAEAIPHYETATGLGLDDERNAEALAYLAGSLPKAGRPHNALQRLMQSGHG